MFKYLLLSTCSLLFYIDCSTFLYISASAPSRQETEPEVSTPGRPGAQLHSLLLPTSDFEEECRSESDEDRDKQDQIVTLNIDVDGGKSHCIHLLISRKGVTKVTSEAVDDHLVNVTRTTVPIVFCPPTKFQEKKAEIENINNCISSNGADLVVTGVGVRAGPSQDVGQTSNNKQVKRSLSPVLCQVASPRKPGSELIRQRTFVETYSQTSVNSLGVGPDIPDSQDCHSLTDRQIKVTTNVKVVESVTQTQQEKFEEKDTQTEVFKEDVTVFGTQTIPVAMSQASIQTEPSHVVEEVITQNIPSLTRTPRYEITFAGTQTSPRITAITGMTSHTQTSPQVTSRTRESSPSSCRTSSLPAAGAGMMTEDAADEMVCRVLLEHAGVSDSDQDDTKSAISDSSTIPDDTDRSASFLSGESGRATSYDNKLQKVKDLSRTVNYLDLSRLGNEGETPNSDEIWVTVEDDNKFLTSDTETYSVATDKVSTMATFKGHAVGSGFAENIALLNSASETELAELGNESLASDLEGQDFSLQNFGNLLHHQMEPIRTRLDSTGRTVSGIAETLYHIQVIFSKLNNSNNGTILTISQDGINNLCCNVTQMKSKVLSNGFEEAEQENTMFVADETVKGDEKLELIKDGVPVGEPEHLVEKMMVKLDSALRRRDENIKNVMLSLEEDNKQLRQELELYRQREIGASEQSTQLESKIQMVLDSMEKLSQKSVPSKSPRSDNSSKDPTPPIAETKPKFKRRSKSRPKDSLEQSSSEGNPKEIPKLKPKRQSAFANDSTSSDSDTQQQKPNKSKSAIKVDKLQVMVTNTQTENVALKQDLVEQKEKEAQLVKRNLELEAQLVKALTPSDDKSRSPVVTPASSEAQKKVDQETREVQTSATGVRNCSSAAVNTDATPGPVLYVESPSSSSPSKSDSPVKDDNILKTKTQTRKSRARVKVTKGASSGEVTEVGEVHGRGNGVDGGTPSPSPSRDKEGERDKEKKLVTPPKTEAKTNGNGNKNNANGNSKSRSLSKSNGNGNGKKAPVKANDNKTVKKEANGGKKTTFEEPKKKAEDSKKAKGVTNGNKAAVNLGTKNASDTKSKVIEGDDFRVTITSNADLVSCEFSDVEDPGSPRKKIIVTPKTPDSKKQEQKKQEVVKKGGKIPIRETYIKQKAELPAPQQYPAARPSRDQLPHPVPKNYSGSCGASPNFTSPLALSLNQPMTVNYVGYNTCQPPTPINDHTIMCSPSDRSLASTNIPFSGRNTVMSYDGSDVFTMMIKQESRDSNVYDAPSYIPDIYTRESPDGAYSYVIDGPAISSMSNISDLKHDVEINEEESSDGFEKDIIRDFVMLEENKKYSLDRRKGATPFKGYAEKVKQKVIREYVNPIRNNKVDFSEKDRPPTRVLPVRKQQAKRLLKSRSQSLSVDQLNELSDGGSKKHPVRMTKSRNTYYSTERLPTLTASEEERIIRLKKYEDDTEKLNEKRAAALRVKEAKEKYKSRKQKSFHYDNEVTIYETNRPWTVPDELTIEDNAADCGLEDNNDTEVNANYHESAANKIEGLTNGVEASEDDQNNNKQTEEGNGSLSQKRRKLKKWRGLSPMAKVNNKVVGFNQLPLSVECFIVGRGWQVDQAQLNKAIARLDGINFVRIQIANTINRVVENIRPHNDVVLIHIGTNELSEACHSINTEENVPGIYKLLKDCGKNTNFILYQVWQEAWPRCSHVTSSPPAEHSEKQSWWCQCPYQEIQLTIKITILTILYNFTIH